MARHHDDDKETMLAPLLAGLAILFVFGFLMWLTAGHRIVHGTLRPALFFGAMWKWIPSDFTYSQWNQVVRVVQASAPQPWTVSFVSWLDLVAVAFRPLLILLMTAYLVSLIFIARNRQGFMRRFTAEQLMLQTVKTFTGVAPVIAIREQVAKNLNPKWRRQVAPEEVFLNYRVPKDAPGLAPAGAPMVRDRKFDREVARTYFMGLRQQARAGLQRSEMLGRQVIDLVKDTQGAASAVFSDRMSAEGKTLLALWSAVAFGGKEGRDEFARFRDMLNHSAFGTKDGMANLALAQPLYNKYRKHPMLSKIFAIHHWEHTVLFFLLSLAQKKGRFTTAEVLWLRPTNRVMFFALNSRGSFTPHTEAAATFAQFAFEAACARAGRLPLVRHPDGGLMHMIFIEKAVDGLELEYARWAEGTDSDDDWWLRKDIWLRSNNAVLEWVKQASSTAPRASMPGAAAATPFDQATAAQARADEAAAARTFSDEMARVFGANGTANP